MYYHAKIYTITLTGKHINPVTCEKCSTEFHYDLTRTAKGQGSAPYGIGKESAKKRAEKAARKKLAKRLDRDIELVPCPSCRWINADAIRTYRKTKCRGWLTFAVTALIIGAAIDLIMVLAADDLFGKPIPLTDPALWIVALLALALAAAALVIQRTLRLRIDPNILINGQPTVPPGTPPALLKEASPSGGFLFTPVPSEFSNLQTDASWATFRPGQLSFHPLCCQCLDAATSSYRLPLPVTKPLAVPICQPCLRRIRTQWILKNLAMILPAVLIGGLVSRLPSGIDDAGRIVLWVLVAAFVAVVGLVIIDNLARPYRLRVIDKSRGICKIAFKNPAYTALLIRKIAESDGLYPKPS